MSVRFRIELAVLFVTSCGQPFWTPRSAAPEVLPSPPATAAAIETITLGRGPCLGSCPAYTIRLERGSATYSGYEHAPRTGQFEATLPPATFDSLAARTLASGFFALSSFYPVPIDAPSVEVAVTYWCDTMCTKHTVAPTRAPGVLESLAATIDSLAADRSWTFIGPAPRR